MTKTVKRILSGILIFAITVAMTPFAFQNLTQSAQAATTTDYSVNVTYGQTEARSMLSSINTFRKGSDAWYWDSTDTNKVAVSGLSNLTYDYTLEKIAMQRAAEIALSFSHTRPNGESYSTAYTGTWAAYGENIAAGYSTAQEAFEGWQETNENYSGQGHRRNMLSSNFAAVGIGHVVYNGTHYWVQEFGKASSLNTTETTAADAAKDVTISVSSDQISSQTVTANPTSLSLEVGGSKTLPTASLVLKLEDAWPSTNAISATQSASWTSSDTSVITVSGGNVTAVSAGTANLTATVSGEKLTVPVTVSAVGISDATVTLDQGTYTYDGSAKKPAVTVKVGGGDSR